MWLYIPSPTGIDEFIRLDKIVQVSVGENNVYFEQVNHSPSDSYGVPLKRFNQVKLVTDAEMIVMLMTRVKVKAHEPA